MTARHLLTVLVAACLCLALHACKKSDDEGSKPKADPDEAARTALGLLADKAIAAYEKDGNLFKKTDVIVFCRGGQTVEEGLFAELGFEPPAEASGLSYCYNVSDERKKLALSAGSELADERMCIFLDGTGAKMDRQPPRKAKSCIPE